MPVRSALATVLSLAALGVRECRAGARDARYALLDTVQGTEGVEIEGVCHSIAYTASTRRGVPDLVELGSSHGGRCELRERLHADFHLSRVKERNQPSSISSTTRSGRVRTSVTAAATRLGLPGKGPAARCAAVLPLVASAGRLPDAASPLGRG